MILLTVLDSLYIVVNSLLQSLSKYKVLFISVISGILLNIILDIPLMHLFNNIGLQAYHGAILSTFIGTIVSLTISFGYLKKKLNFKYNETLKILPKTIINIIILIIIDLLLSFILPINSTSRLTQIFNLSILGIITVYIYLMLNRNNLKEILPENILKILRKIKIPV